MGDRPPSYLAVTGRRMNLVYNSDSYAVVQITLDDAARASADAGPDDTEPRGGYEIVDKFARRGIYLDGPVARCFREGVQALARDHAPSVEELDAYIAGYAGLAQLPLGVH